MYLLYLEYFLNQIMLKRLFSKKTTKPIVIVEKKPIVIVEKKPKFIVDKQTNQVFNSKDLLTLIASYIIPPFFSKNDWNTFSKLCKTTSRISSIQKHKKAIEFNVDLISFDKNRIVKEAHEKLLKIDAIKRDKSVRSTMNYDNWKSSSISKISDVINGNNAYFSKSFSFADSSLMTDALKIILDETIALFDKKPFSFIASSDYKMEKIINDCFSKIPLKTNVKKFVTSSFLQSNLSSYVQSNNECVIFINTRIFRDKNILNLIICNTIMHQKAITNNILESAQNDRKCYISVENDNERYVVYDFIMNSKELSKHVEFTY